jgi:hypothetical protein
MRADQPRVSPRARYCVREARPSTGFLFDRRRGTTGTCGAPEPLLLRNAPIYDTLRAGQIARARVGPVLEQRSIKV